MRVWYRVRDLDAARQWYTGKLGFEETYSTSPAAGPSSSAGRCRSRSPRRARRRGVATVDVDDVKAEADRLREDDIEVGTVLELHNEVRLLDVYDPDGNRLQLVQELRR